MLLFVITFNKYLLFTIINFRNTDTLQNYQQNQFEQDLSQTRSNPIFKYPMFLVITSKCSHKMSTIICLLIKHTKRKHYLFLNCTTHFASYFLNGDLKWILVIDICGSLLWHLLFESVKGKDDFANQRLSKREKSW